MNLLYDLQFSTDLESEFVKLEMSDSSEAEDDSAPPSSPLEEKKKPAPVKNRLGGTRPLKQGTLTQMSRSASSSAGTKGTRVVVPLPKEKMYRAPVAVVKPIKAQQTYNKIILRSCSANVVPKFHVS